MIALLDRSMPWIVYPSVMALSVVLYLSMLGAGFALGPSAYIPMLMAATIVTILEWHYPYRAQWQPEPKEVRADMAFMLAIQGVWPPIVTWLLVLALIEPLQALDLPIGGIWPRELPIGVQVVLLILASDFLRYWLHRAAHTHPLLWRLHAVHHSPERLYWLNVGRFHPLEKALQLMAETVPFVLFGAPETVIAFHFVLYATNGFFQHCNIRLRYGWLNYLVAGAELHRWHHSRVPAESNRNFGNNVIVWDLLFGTWYLPQEREVGGLGLRNRRYPTSFPAQMRTPFVASITDRDVSLRPLGDIMRGGALRVMMMFCRLRYWMPLTRAAREPAAVQRRVLHRILRTNRDTRFGREHGFSEIDGYDEFTRRVPIQDYETLRPYIEEQMQTGATALTRDAPVMYTQTSGTTAAPKLIPALKRTIADYRAEQQLFTSILYRFCPAAFVGKVLAIVSPAVERCLPCGVPVGALSGHLYATMPKPVRTNTVVPAEVFRLRDYELKYRLILRLALTERDITYMATANPSSFLQLLAILDTDRETFTVDLEHGGFTGIERLDSTLRTAILPRLKADPEHAAVLRATQGRALGFADFWPGIRLVSTWTAGSCGIALDALRARLPADARIVDLGYLASEVQATVTLDCESDAGVPMLQHHFFEFAERRAWDAGDKRTVTMEALVEDHEYYVIITTAAGLYRYFMNDIVRVTGRLAATPLLKFVQKGRGVTSITGEKLYEGQVIEAVHAAQRRLGFTSVFFVLLADEMRAGYRLYLEPDGTRVLAVQAIADGVERALAEINMEYKEKRASGRLAPLAASILGFGTGDAYKAMHLAAGQRDTQYKPVVLTYARDCWFPFAEHVAGEDAANGRVAGTGTL